MSTLQSLADSPAVCRNSTSVSCRACGIFAVFKLDWQGALHKVGFPSATDVYPSSSIHEAVLACRAEHDHGRPKWLGLAGLVFLNK